MQFLKIAVCETEFSQQLVVTIKLYVIIQTINNVYLRYCWLKRNSEWKYTMQINYRTCNYKTVRNNSNNE